MTSEQRRLGPFLLEEQIGAGGMGVVYRATHVETHRKVAIKLLSARAAMRRRIVRRFARELDILKTLSHPNIVKCYGGGRYEKEAFLVLELVPGGSLGSLIRRRGRLSWEAAIDYALQICAGLQYAHDNGIVHRDLTPGNLLLTEDGHIKIADFGIARVQYGERLTATKHTLGTVAYMAPEQIHGKQPVSHKTDLYSLGCVLYEMLTGKVPFEAESTAQMIFQHLTTTPARVSTLALDCPIWLEALVEQLLKKDPADRPLDASTVAVALTEVKHKIAAGVSVTAHAVTGGPTTLKVPKDTVSVGRLLGRKKRKAKQSLPLHERAWFLAACLSLVVAIGVWCFWPASEAELFAEAEALMATGDRVKWKEARLNYLEPLLERFPKGEYADEAQQFIDEIDMKNAEARLRVSTRLGRAPTSEGERLYADAWRYEQFGDRVTALEKYQALVNLVDASGEHRPYVKLAERQIAALMGETAGPASRVEFIEERLRRADEFYEKGEVLEAHKIWNSIVTLYSGNRELVPLVERAMAKLRIKDNASGEAEPEQEESEE